MPINTSNAILLYMALTITLGYSNAFASQKDSIKIESWLDEGFKLVYSKPDYSKSLFMKAIRESQKIDNKNLEAQAVNYLGIYYDISGKNDSALLFYNQALVLVNNFKIVRIKPSVLNNLGLIALNENRLKDAFSLFIEALEASKKIKDENMMANVNSNIGIVYKKQENLVGAIQAEKRTLSFRLSSKDSSGISASVQRIGNYYNRAESDSALYYFQWARRLGENSEDKWALGFIYHNLANYYIREVGYDSAIVYIEKAIEIRKQFDHKRYLAGDYYSLGIILKEQGKTQESIAILTRAKELQFESSKDDQLLNVYKVLGELYEKQGNYKSAAEIYKKQITLSDSLSIIAKESELQELQVKYESEKKNREITEQAIEISKAEQGKYWFWACIIFLLTLAAFVWNIAIQRKRKNELLKSQAEELEKLDAMKERFFTNISHELRTPVTLILAPLQKLLEKNKKPGDTKDIQLAYQNGNKLLGMINEILDLSKIESGHINTYYQDVNLYEHVNQLFYSFGALVERSGTKLSFIYHLSKQTIVRVDQAKLDVILTNLIGNAIKFTEEQGSVTLEVDYNKERLEFVVSDTGRGINEEDLPHVFKRFYQSMSVNSPNRGGAGIGLALSKEFAALMGGDLAVTSTNNEGTIFTFHLPQEVLQEEGSYSYKSELSGEDLVYVPSLFQSNKPKILVVEDNEDMREFIITLLSTNYNCVGAKNGVEALSKVKDESFDLITCDLMMPLMDGFEFREKLRNKPSYRDIPFVLITAQNTSEDKLRSLQMGVDDYIEKPFNIQEVEARISGLLQNKMGRESVVMESGEHTYDTKLLKKAEGIVLRNIDNSTFHVSELASEMAYSERQLSRILTKLTGFNTVSFLREIRLQQAMRLIKSKEHKTIKSVVQAVGFENPSYFARKFSERFGQNPSGYM